MKISKIFAIAAIVAVMAACGKTPEGSKEVRELLPTRTEVDSASYLLGVNFGMMIKNYGFGELNYSQLLKGMKTAANAEGNPQDSTFAKQFKIDPNEMGRILDGHLDKMYAYKAALNDEKGKNFIAEFLKEDGAQSTVSGLAYKIIEEGEAGTNPTSLQDTVKVNYVGTLIDGSQFDAGEGAEFPLNRVVEGWGEGLQLVGKGGKIELVIPANLAYGERGRRGIDPNSTLKFVVDLLDVMPYVEPVVEEPAAPAKKK